MSDFYIKQNDTSPSFQATLLNGSGNLVPYVGATSVKFHVVNKAGAVIVNEDMTQTSPSTGIVTYEWTNEDTAVAQIMYAEIQVTFADGKVQTFPNYGNLSIIVSGQIL